MRCPRCAVEIPPAEACPPDCACGGLCASCASADIALLVMRTLACSMQNDQDGAADALEELGQRGWKDVFGGLCAFAQAIAYNYKTGEQLNTADRIGGWRLAVVDESGNDRVDDGPMEVRWVGRFMAAFLNQDMETAHALARTAHEAGELEKVTALMVRIAAGMLVDAKQQRESGSGTGT